MTKRMKRIFAFLCAFALLVSTVLGTGIMNGAKAAAEEPTPVTLEGFNTISIEDFVDEQGNPMPAGEYVGAKTGAHNVFYADGLSNLDKKLLSLKITYEGGDYKHSLIFGGNGGWCGFNLRPNGDGSKLFIDSSWAGDIIDKATYVAPYMEASVAGLDSFIGNEFLLQMSFAYGEVDANNKADLTIGVYINGKLYNDQTFTIADCNMDKAGNVLALYREVDGSNIIVKSFDEKKIEPVVLDGFKTLSIEDFSNAQGEMPSGRYDGEVGGAHKDYSVADLANFDKTLLSMKVTYTAGTYKTRLDIGGNAGWTGFSLQPNADGSKLEIRNNYGMTSMATTELPTLSATAAGLTSFINNEFLLQMSFEYDDTNLILGVYINGQLYNNQKFTITGCTMSKMGSHLAFYGEDVNGSVILKSINEEEEPENPDEPEVPDTPSEDLEEVTYVDFGLKEKVYTYVSGDLAVKGALTDKNSLAGTIAGGDVQMDGTGEYQVILGGISNGWDGLRMMVNNDRIHTYWYQGTAGTFIKTLYPGTAGVDFVGSKFNLKVSMELVDNDADGQTNDIKVGYWFNNALYENSYEIISNVGDQLGNLFGVYCANESDTVTLGTPSADDDEDQGDDTPKQPNPSLKAYNFANFGIKDKVYKAIAGDFSVQGSLNGKDSLANTIVGNDIQLDGEGEYQIVLGGKTHSWNGLRLMVKGNRIHTYWFNDAGGTFIKTLDQAKSGVNFIGEKYNLKVSMELIDDLGDGKKNDIQVGIWFNDVLYGNEYMILTNRGDELGNRLGIYCELEGDTATVGTPSPDADKPIEPNANFEKLTFAHFGIKDAEYPYNGDVVVQGTIDSKENINKTVICGNILMTAGGNYQLLFGSKENIWDGLRLITNDNSMHVYWYQGHVGTYLKSLSPAVAGVKFTGEEFNLMLSSELVDNDGDGKKNDVKFGIWFNGVLYENDFMIFPNIGKQLGNMMGAYCATEGTTVTFTSIPELTPEPEPLKQPNKDFKKLTFSHFSAEDGTYKCDGTTATTLEGKADRSLDRTILCGDIRLNGTGDTHLMLGGVTNVWYGYRFVLLSNGNLALYWIDEEGMYLIEIFDPVTAGTPLLDTWFNIMISNEIVDADDDGEKDDLELGVWFNGVLYKNKYLTVLNEAKDFGQWFGFDCATEGTSISIKSIPELVEGFNYAKFGLTEDWEDTLLKTGLKAGMAVGGSQDAKPFTGDWFDERKVYFCGFAAVAALVAGIYLMMQRKKEI